MTAEHAAVQEAARRLGVQESADSERPSRHSGPSRLRTRERSRRRQGEARRRSLRWMELGWEGATTAAREEARKEAVLEMLRALVEDSRRGVKAQVFVTPWESLW